MIERLFVYGTLMEPAIQREVFGREISGATDSLYGYRLGTVTFGNETFPAIRSVSLKSGEDGHNSGKAFFAGRVRSPEIKSGTGEDEVSGIVLTLSDEELSEADFYEGEYYARKEVSLKSGLKAWVYVIED
ncbi:gamma-glutamylcyclotransferase family protein [Methanoplanus endosymbiosus]|uniref:Putative gamma-glutamylcyclotransferase n=1 Tax=Methanoplanus endosymbiosus TaxID=33865 RepID=A0A9E7PJZ1_9EURY|nr:gamma-glutamylcyclotransferase family protein [Methanoplanus endosymbiosus]UUX91370.1 gamma-glutamylcyclotransferase [Methanoplanus endosymbiosus]